ncbi:MAG TPA: peptidyl-prolyl cis-trans isomerase [Solirubrobacteraceae bacterium]|nr:peptidyl-prolyl cis-trans isomerase [Solirubrobacteraceae bacterium]
MSKKVISFVAALGAVFFAAVGLAACGGGVPGNAVAQVGGTPITKETFEHWMGVAAASTATTPGEKPAIPVPPDYTECIAHLEATSAAAKGKSKPSKSELKSECEQQYKSLKQEVLGFLISSSWVLGEAESLGVKVSDAEVKKQFEKIKTEQFPKAEEFKKFLESSGQTVSDLLLRVKLNLLSTKIQQKVSKKGAVTEAQIEKYYNEHKSQFGTPEKRDLLVVLTKTEAEAQQAKKEIESGKSFAEVAKSKSIDPTSKSNGGEVKGVVKGQEAKALDEAAFSAKQGVLGGPVKTPFGYYIYEVKSISPGNSQSLAQAKSTIKQQLSTTSSQQALSKFVKEFRKNWTSKTECASGFVVQNCREYVKPKTSSTGAPSTATTTPSTTSTPSTTTTTAK